MAGVGGNLKNPGFFRNTQGQNPYTLDRGFSASIPTQAEDYDDIMQGYRNLMGGSNPYADLISQYQSALSNSGNQFSPVSYTEAPEWREAYNKAKEYASTGGLSEAEQGSLRARAISPIRSMYANMTRNMDRQRRLSGGFSPNYNATAARMAREGSEQIAQTTTNANAAIAEMVQKGRLAMTPEMARLASGKNELMNQVNLQNARNRIDAGGNQASLLSGYGNALNNQQGNQIDILKGMTSLYGTNPGLVQTFGNLSQNQQQINNQAANQQAQNKFNRQRAVLGY